MNRRDFIARAGAILAMASAVAVASAPRRHKWGYVDAFCTHCRVSREAFEEGWAPVCPVDWDEVARRRMTALLGPMRLTTHEALDNYFIKKPWALFDT